MAHREWLSGKSADQYLPKPGIIEDGSTGYDGFGQGARRYAGAGEIGVESDFADEERDRCWISELFGQARGWAIKARLACQEIKFLIEGC